MCYGVHYNFTDGICIPEGKGWTKDKTFFNEWLQVYPGKYRVCIHCTSDGTFSCVDHREAHGPENGIVLLNETEIESQREAETVKPTFQDTQN